MGNYTLSTVGVTLGLVVALVLAEPEAETIGKVSELKVEMEADPEREPGVEPVHLKDSPEDVIGGDVAKPNPWPWQVRSQDRDGFWYVHNCGGTVIRSNWVMAAAHCVDR